jgi:hypothetical protein
MIDDQRQVEYFKKIASELYIPMVLSEYGANRKDTLIHLTDTISAAYRHLDYNSFKTVIFYVSLESTTALSSLQGSNSKVVTSYESLTQLRGESIVIEAKQNGELHYAINFQADIQQLRLNAIVYHFKSENGVEIFYGKSSERTLLSIPDADSYFAIQTYKSLDSALEDYGSKVARHSECQDLQKAWFDPNRIFFKPKPEHLLRDSLTRFLKLRLRNTEVRPEQNVDTSHPVDIKVTWSLASRLALIEIKWLGKSLAEYGKDFTQTYTQQRALDGAQQLADYLDENAKQAPVKTTRGYLVVYDARRWNCNNQTTTVDRPNGMKYENGSIAYNPQFHLTRQDFAIPRQFFMEPVVTS